MGNGRESNMYADVPASIHGLGAVHPRMEWITHAARVRSVHGWSGSPTQLGCGPLGVRSIHGWSGSPKQLGCGPSTDGVDHPSSSGATPMRLGSVRPKLDLTPSREGSRSIYRQDPSSAPRRFSAPLDPDAHLIRRVTWLHMDDPGMAAHRAVLDVGLRPTATKVDDELFSRAAEGTRDLMCHGGSVASETTLAHVRSFTRPLSSSSCSASSKPLDQGRRGPHV
jgi:hypothetical protein